ncbi:MAG: hypothetical protein AB7S54_09945 [Bacteroidales bacterium]
MNLSMVFIGLLFLAFFLGPVIYIHWVQKNKSKSKQKYFFALADKHQVTITEYDSWGTGNYIGIDADSGKMFVLKILDGNETTSLIDLNGVLKCRVVTVNKSFKGRSGKVLERIDLAFTFRDPSTPEKSITFYDVNDSSTLAEEQSLSEKWLDKVNGYLRGMEV